jgi:hypothetical protein
MIIIIITIICIVACGVVTVAVNAVAAFLITELVIFFVIL